MQLWFFWQHLKASQPHLPPAPEVIRGRWTSPETLLQPLPTPGGPCLRSQVHPELHSKCRDPDESHVQPHPAPNHSSQRNTREKGFQEPLQRSENHLRDPTFVRTFWIQVERERLLQEIQRQVEFLTLGSVLEKNNSFVIVRVMCVWTVALAATLLEKLTLRTHNAFLDRLRSPPLKLIHSSSPLSERGLGFIYFFAYLSSLCVNLLWEWWGKTLSFADFCRALLPDPFWNPIWFISINRATGSLIVYICWFDWRLNRGSNHRRIPGAASCRCVTHSSVFWGGGCHQNLAYSALSITSLSL